MKKITVAILLFATIPCYSQWALFYESKLWDNEYHYVDTTSFVSIEIGKDSAIVSVNKIQSGEIIIGKKGVKEYTCNIIVTKKPAQNNLLALGDFVRTETIVFTPSQLYLRPYLDRWLERQKLAESKRR